VNRKSRVATLLSLLVLAILVFVPVASAYDGRGGERVVVTSDEVINDDLYVGANTVVVDGTVNGDLIAGGQTVTINGKVTGNVIAVGSSITVNGEVGHDVLAAASVVTIGRDARVGHNAYTAAASVESQPGSQIGGSLLIGAGQGLVSGQVTNDLLAAANRVRLEGTVGRDARIAAAGSDSNWTMWYGPNTPPMPFVQPGLTFGEGARVAGSLEYTSPQPVVGVNSVSTEVTHHLPAQDRQLSQELSQQDRTSSYLFDALRRLIALLLVGLLVAWLAPRWITGPAENLLSKPLPSLGIGLAGLVAVPISWLVALGVVILVAVVFGLLSLGNLTVLTLLAGLPALGVVVVAIVFAVSYLAHAIVAYLGGRWILGRIRPDWNGSIYGPVLLGLFILGLLFAVPVVGGLLEFLAVLVGLGAMLLTVFRRSDGTRTPEAPAALPAVTAA